MEWRPLPRNDSRKISLQAATFFLLRFYSNLVELDGRYVVTAPREVGWHRRQIGLGTDVDDEVHTDQDVELEVAVE